MNQKIQNNLALCLIEGLNPSKGQKVEIFASKYEKEFTDLLYNNLKSITSDVFITDYTKPLSKEIYQQLMFNNFSRITLYSPDFMTYPKSYPFLDNYFRTCQSQYVYTFIPNDIYSNKISISKDKLYHIILELAKNYNMNIKYQKTLNNLKLERLEIIDNFNHKLSIGLTKESIFLSKYLKAKNNIIFRPNIPSLEVFISPNKYDINGDIFLKKMNYKTKFIKDFTLNIKDGYILDNPILDEIFVKDKSSRYLGEVALVENNILSNIDWYNTLLDENSSSHIAIGNAYKEGIIELNKVNSSNIHLDLILDNLNTKIYGFSKNDKYLLMDGGVFNAKLQ